MEALLALPAGPLLAYLDSVLTSIETTIMCHGKPSASGPVVVVCANCTKLGHCYEQCRLDLSMWRSLYCWYIWLGENVLNGTNFCFAEKSFSKYN